MQVRAQLTDKQFDYMLEHFPIRASDMVRFKTEHSHIKEVPLDLSFENFWRTYNFKFGNKLRAEKIWNMLPLQEQVCAFEFIKRYDGQLAISRTAKAYPETYLSQQRWNNHK
jgi:hypothetical protein